MAGYRRKDGKPLAADETVVTVDLRGFEYCKLPTLARTLDISANQMREVLGEVVLTKRSAKDCLAHGLNREKIAVFVKVHEVIRLGVIFDRQQNWKGRGYDTAVLAAPISIGCTEYICEVIVEQRPNRQGFYLHEVVVKEKLGNVFKTSTKGGTRQASRSILVLRDSEVNSIWKNCSKIVDENGEPLVVYHGSQKKKDLACLTRNMDIMLMQSGLAIVRMWPRIGAEQAAPCALTIA